MNLPVYTQISCGPNMASVQLEPIAMPRTRESAYNIEDPQFPLDDPSVWTEGSSSSSGERITPCRVLAVPAAYQAVTRISGDIARCPLELWRETEDGVWELQRDDPLARLVSIQPNREMDAFTFWQRVMVHRLVFQNAYIYVATNAAGEPAELLPLLPDRTEPKRKGGVLYFMTETNGQPQPIPANRVIHLQGIGFDNLKAYELCKAMRDAIGLALSQMNFAARVFRSGGRRGGVLEIPLSMSKVSADRLEEGFRKKYENPNAAFTTVILRDNAKFHEAQMTLRDSQSIEGRKESVRDIARAYNMRPGNLGEGDNGVYGNKYEDTRDYLDMTLKPHMAGISGQARIKLLPLERQARECFEHNTDDLLQMSPKEQFEAYGTGVEKTIITSNEARGKLGFKPHPSGNELRSPHTQSDQGAPKAGRESPPPDTPGEDEDDVEAAYARLQQVHTDLVRRNVTDVVAVIGERAVRAAASGKKFCDWLDQTLPTKRDNLVRAGLPEKAAGAELDRISAGLAAIAETNHESTLREAVESFFQTWEFSHD